MNKKTALVIAFTPLYRDERVSRQISYLRELDFEITTVGLESPKLEGVHFISSNVPYCVSLYRIKKAFNLLTRNFDRQYWNIPQIRYIYEKLKDTFFDVYISNDLDTLPLTLKLAKGRKIIFDAHEYAPCEFADRFIWNLLNKNYLNYLCKKYLPQAKVMTTVCEGIAQEYHKNYQVHSEVITNAPPFYHLEPRSTESDQIRMIYHGIAIPSRRVDDAITIMDSLDDRFTLDMILIPGKQTYIEKIKKSASRNPRIRFISPVEMKKIPNLCNEYDIGFYPLRATNLNNYYSLPNKFFQFIQGRVALAIYPLPAMSRIVKKYGCGLIAPDFDPQNFAKDLNKLSKEKIWEMKQNSHKAANDHCAEENYKIFRNLITQTLNS